MRLLGPEGPSAMAARMGHPCRWLQVARVCMAGSTVTIGLTGGATRAGRWRRSGEREQWWIQSCCKLTLSDRRCSSSVHQFVSLEVAGGRDPRNDWADGPGGGTNKKLQNASRVTCRPLRSLTGPSSPFLGPFSSEPRCLWGYSPPLDHTCG